MLIDITKYLIKCRTVVQVGCHLCQEHETFLKMGIRRFIYIEPAIKAFSSISKRFEIDKSVYLYNVACGEKVSKGFLNIETANNGQSNSLLEMGSHLQQHPGINFTHKQEVSIIPLDFIDTMDANFLMLDCQGAEGLILKGATETLKKIDWVYTEVNRGETYKGCSLVSEIDKILSDFVEVETQWWTPSGSWGDRLYKRVIKN